MASSTWKRADLLSGTLVVDMHSAPCATDCFGRNKSRAADTSHVLNASPRSPSRRNQLRYARYLDIERAQLPSANTVHIAAAENSVGRQPAAAKRRTGKRGQD